MRGPSFFLLKKPIVENQRAIFSYITETLLQLFKSGLVENMFCLNLKLGLHVISSG